MKNLLSIGKIINFHGIQGEAKVGYTLGNENLLKNLKYVFICFNSNLIKKEIEFIRFHKRHALIKFKDINDLNEIIPFKDCVLKVEKSQIDINLEKDEYLIKDLINSEAFDEKNNKLGIIVDVDETPASSILKIKTLKNEFVMVPFVKALVPKVNLKENKIIINNIEGLF